MANYITILIAFLTFINFAFGGLLHGESYSAFAAPSVDYNLARIVPFSSPFTSNPVGASYSSRYTAYTAVPLSSSYAAAAPIPRFAASGLPYTYAASSLLRNSGFSSPLVRRSVSVYAAVPIGGYRAAFRGPLLRNYGDSLRSFPAPLSAHNGLYPAPVFNGYENPIVTDERSFGTFENENPVAVW